MQSRYRFLTALFVLLSGTLLMQGAEARMPQPEISELPPQIQNNLSKLFISGISSETFDNLTLEDIPSFSTVIPHVVYGTALLVGAEQHILAYDLTGTFLGMSDPNLVDCVDDLAIIDSKLYVACRSKGVTEFNLSTGEKTYEFTSINGLQNLDNLQFAVSGGFLWTGTFDGLARINPVTRTVTWYREELGIPGSAFETDVFAGNGQLWAIVSANAYSVGGASLYQPESNTWLAFTPEDFGKQDTSRIDFERFLVTNKGTFALYSDQGPQDKLIAQFDPATQMWKIVKHTAYPHQLEDLSQFVGEDAVNWYLNAPPPQDPLPVPVTIDGVTHHVPIHYASHTFLSPQWDNTYYVLSSAGLEKFAKGDKIPYVVLPGDFTLLPAEIFRVPNTSYLIILEADQWNIDGSLHSYIVTVYDMTTGHSFQATLPSPTMEWIESLAGTTLTQIGPGPQLILRHPTLFIIEIDIGQESMSISPA